MTSLRQCLALTGKGVISLVGAGGKTSFMFRLAHEFSASKDTVLTTTTTKISPPTRDQSRCLVLSHSPHEIVERAKKMLLQSPHVSAAKGYEATQERLIGLPPETIQLFRNSMHFRWIIVEADGAARRLLKAPAPHEPVIPECTEWVIGFMGLNAFGEPLDDNVVFRPERVSAITGLPEGKRIEAKTFCDLIVHKQGLFKGTPVGAKQIVFLNHADNLENIRAGRSIVKILNKMKRANIARVVIGDTYAESPVREWHDL